MFNIRNHAEEELYDGIGIKITILKNSIHLKLLKSNSLFAISLLFTPINKTKVKNLDGIGKVKYIKRKLTEKITIPKNGYFLDKSECVPVFTIVSVNMWFLI